MDLLILEVRCFDGAVSWGATSSLNSQTSWVRHSVDLLASMLEIEAELHHHRRRLGWTFVLTGEAQEAEQEVRPPTNNIRGRFSLLGMRSS